MPHFDNFTQEAIQVFESAMQEAARFGHPYVDTGHVLLGIIQNPQNAGSRLLTNLKVNRSATRVMVTMLLERPQQPLIQEKDLTRGTKRAIERAIDESRRFGGGLIGTEHLLLGLIREGQGIAAVVLEAQGVNLLRARDKMPENAYRSGADSQHIPGWIESERDSPCPPEYPFRGIGGPRIFFSSGQRGADFHYSDYCFMSEDEARTAGYAKAGLEWGQSEDGAG